MNLDHGALVHEAGNRRLFDNLAGALDVPVVKTQRRRFPDGESYVRVTSEVPDGPVLVFCSLDRPDPKFLPLVYLSNLLREEGAREVVLVAPYLAYMRQDRRFKPGEAVTSRSFAGLVSRAFDGLVTVDPHLHRYGSLHELYEVPTRAVHAGPALADWIQREVEDPLVVGPDAESEQWVGEVAGRIGAPSRVLTKTRRGDRDVEVRFEDPGGFTDRTPVLVDDIVSTAGTMAEAVEVLREAGYADPVCVGIHAIFADDARESLTRAGARRIATANSVEHPTNDIDLSGVLADGIHRGLEG